MAHVTWLDSGNVDWGYHGPGWYFWDETGAYCHGPYESAELAYIGLEKYCKEELG